MRRGRKMESGKIQKVEGRRGKLIWSKCMVSWCISNLTTPDIKSHVPHLPVTKGKRRKIYPPFYQNLPTLPYDPGRAWPTDRDADSRSCRDVRRLRRWRCRLCGKSHCRAAADSSRIWSRDARESADFSCISGKTRR